MTDVWVVRFTKRGRGPQRDSSHVMMVRRDLYSEAEARSAPFRVFGSAMVRRVDDVTAGVS